MLCKSNCGCSSHRNLICNQEKEEYYSSVNYTCVPCGKNMTLDISSGAGVNGNYHNCQCRIGHVAITTTCSVCRRIKLVRLLSHFCLCVCHNLFRMDLEIALNCLVYRALLRVTLTYLHVLCVGIPPWV